MKVLGNLVGRRHDVAHVGVLGLAQRSGHADVDSIEIADYSKVRGGIQVAGFHQLRDIAAGNILNVGFALHQAVYARLLQVDAGYVEACLGKFNRERQPNIAQSHDADVRGLRPDLVLECLECAHGLLHNLHESISCDACVCCRHLQGRRGGILANL